jgi:hypothetical protein
MTLCFLNDCRSFDPERNSVSFWGHDGAFEVTFRLVESALLRISGHDRPGEAAALAAFDTNRDCIRNAAQRIYNRKPKQRFAT